MNCGNVPGSSDQMPDQPLQPSLELPPLDQHRRQFKFSMLGQLDCVRRLVVALVVEHAEVGDLDRAADQRGDRARVKPSRQLARDRHVGPDALRALHYRFDLARRCAARYRNGDVRSPGIRVACTPRGRSRWASGVGAA
jgi:hypothetical protein